MPTRWTMSWRWCAPQATGIGLTLLPTLYMRSGFGAAGLRDDQRRFAGTPASVLRWPNPSMHCACRVSTPAWRCIRCAPWTRARWPRQPRPQRRRAGRCTSTLPSRCRRSTTAWRTTGQRPIEWLLDHASLDARWNLVHATHTTPQEMQGLRAAAASVVICPSTEANLGDGVFDYPGWAGQGGCWSIGSDSHVTRRATEELRLLEYSQRLTRRQRNIAAQAGGGGSSAAWLLQGALHGGSAAAGQPLGGLRAGQRADFCVLEAQAPSLAGMAPVHVLDAVVFSSPDAGVAAVHVAGLAGAALHARTQSAFASAMQALWA
jgi:formimidoylglutamate deiminase